MAAIDLIYPRKIKEEVKKPKKTLEMTEEDWPVTIAEGVETLHDELAELTRAVENIAPIPVGRFDISQFDKCAYA